MTTRVEKNGKHYSINTIYTYASGWQSFAWEIDDDGVVGYVPSAADVFYDSEADAYAGHKVAVANFMEEG